MAKKRSRKPVDRERAIATAVSILAEHCKRGVVVMPDLTPQRTSYHRLIPWGDIEPAEVDAMIRDAARYGHTKEEAEDMDREA